MNEAERWYRIAVLAYPREVRARQEDELVGTLLAADAGADADGPSRRELAALVANGARARFGASRGGAPASVLRRQGFVLGGWIALAGAAAIVSSVMLVQLDQRWRAPYPRGFWPAWGMLAVAPVLAPFAATTGRRLRWDTSVTAVVAVAAGLAALIAGPAVFLVSRYHLLAFEAFVAVAAFAPSVSPRARALAGAAAACAVGTATGLVLAAATLRRALAAGAFDRPVRFAWWFDGVLFAGGPGLGPWFALVVVLVVVLVSIGAPRLGLAGAANVVPVGLCLWAFSYPMGARTDVAAVSTVVLLSAAAGLAWALATRASRRRTRTTMAAVR